MPSTSNFPFRRIDVDHLIQGESRIWWQLDDDFNDPGPYVFQLQVGNTGNPNAGDWLDVGSPITNDYYAIDPTQRLYGKLLTTHYRIVLKSAVKTYVSNPTDVLGELDERNWLIAREAVRREMRKHGTLSNEGFILKRRRTGQPSGAVDPLTGSTLDSDDPESYGTGIRGGYYPPLPSQLFGFETVSLQELRRNMRAPGNVQPTKAPQVRVLGFPQILEEDVWVDSKSDERWRVERVEVAASIRRVPIVVILTLSLLPFTDIVYSIPVGSDGPDPADTLPGNGTGCVRVTHDYGGPDALSYQLANGCGVSGATVLAFKKADWDAGLRTAQYAVAATNTGADGRWQFALMLDPGQYVLQFEKKGEAGPDTVNITVVATPPSSGSSASSGSSSFGLY